MGGGIGYGSIDPTADLVIDHATVTNNNALEGGGVWFIANGPTTGGVTLDGATVSGNHLDQSSDFPTFGAGLYVRLGDTLSITDSKIENNVIETPSDSTGDDQFMGGGIAVGMHLTEITRSSISGNSITVPDNGDSAFGGGIAALPTDGGVSPSGPVTITGSTIAGNTLASAIESPTGSFGGGGAYLLVRAPPRSRRCATRPSRATAPATRRTPPAEL